MPKIFFFIFLVGPEREKSKYFKMNRSTKRNGTTSALQPEEITSKGIRVSCVCTINKSAHTKKSLEAYCVLLVFKK